jgi:hypothetical protein
MKIKNRIKNTKNPKLEEKIPKVKPRITPDEERSLFSP